MPFGFHGLDLVVILVIALLIFGPKKLPEMGSAIGKSIKEFKKGMNEITSTDEEKPKVSSPVNLDAIDREIASKKAAAAQPAQSGMAEPEVYTATSNTETPLE
ncbi:MAG TPA: twin-arginine translocase TatA/TatE family subunit [Ktedonobacteraceae bacterium]|nr:twin-arginine translocase TatA/TatE family subunit [Ktedonobacteraceae bacterium]